MKVNLLSLRQGAEQARGLAVVIDVFRAFTCAPIMFDLGVRKIFFVAEPEEGLVLKANRPDLIMVGEVDGVRIEGYEFGNSPLQLLKRDPAYFQGKTAVQRTSSGVQGALIALDRAETVLLAGYVNAQATAEYIKKPAPAEVSIIAMGRSMATPAPEDELCARYIAHLLGAGEYDHRRAIRELVFSPTTRLFTGPDHPHLPPEDPIICLQRDTYGTVIRAGREDGLVVARPVA